MENEQQTQSEVQPQPEPQTDTQVQPTSAPDASQEAAPVEVSPDQLPSDGEQVREGVQEEGGQTNA